MRYALIADIHANLNAFTAVLDAIPGAWESVRRGEADYAAGRFIPLDDL